MNAISFDTLAYVKRLREAGVDAQQAEAQAEALSLAIGESLVTSDELKSTELALRSEIEKLDLNLRAKIEKLDLSLRKELEQLRLEIRDSQMTNIKWLVPLMLGQTAVLAALVKPL